MQKASSNEGSGQGPIWKYQGDWGPEAGVHSRSGPRPRRRKPWTTGATGLARGAGPVFDGDEDRDGDQRPRYDDKRQVGSSWFVRHAVSLTTAPPGSRVVGSARTQGTAPCLFPRGVFYSAGHPTEAGACVHAPNGGRPLTTTFRNANFGYAPGLASANLSNSTLEVGGAGSGMERLKKVAGWSIRRQRDWSSRGTGERVVAVEEGAAFCGFEGTCATSAVSHGTTALARGAFPQDKGPAAMAKRAKRWRAPIPEARYIPSARAGRCRRGSSRPARRARR